MHLRDGDFTKQGNIYIQIVFIPYIALVLVSSLARLHWLILLVPSIAIAGFGFFTWRASRKQVLASTRGLPVAGIVCTGLLVFISWQAYQRQIQMLSWLDNKEVFQEYLELQRYQPFQPNNRLVKLSPKPTLQFDAYTAPRLDGATAAYPVYAALAQAMYPERFVFDKIANNKTPSAYQRLIDGDTDAIFVAQASPEHVKLAKDRGVELIMTPVAREAFVFLVHEDNPVKQLTLAQTKAIYSGQITNWNELGGADTRIVAFQRPKNSGSQTVMEAKVMQGMAMKKPLQEEIQQGMGGLIRQVAAYRNSPSALGYSFRFYATSMQNPKNLSLISINNIAPTIENIRSGTYPLSVDVYMVTTQKSNPSVSQLRDWILSTEGQKLIADSGYIPR